MWLFRISKFVLTSLVGLHCSLHLLLLAQYLVFVPTHYVVLSNTVNTVCMENVLYRAYPMPKLSALPMDTVRLIGKGVPGQSVL